jgi:tetratricopeptide (TPR) repeat protein
MPTISQEDVISLQRRLAEARENLRLIQERESRYVVSTDVPIQLIKEKRRLLDEIAELEQQLGAQHFEPPIQRLASVATSLHQLPAPLADFTGREAELDDLRAALVAGSGAAICGLRGLGGIGKTALALKLAEELTGRYPDAQFFLDLKGTDPQPLSAAEAMSHIVRAYYPTAKLSDSEAELAGLYRSALHGQRALLLMDNAAGREQVEPLIPPASGALLVTSRSHFTLPGMVRKNLDTLPLDDAKALLLRIAARVGDECAGEIARLCDCLPLALRLAGSALAEREDLDPANYLRRLADAQKRLELVNASLSLSYNLLGVELQERWRMLAVFPGTFDRGAAAAVWELDPDPAQDALSELVRYSLVEWDEMAERYRLHDLARLFADARLSQAERESGQRRHAANYVTVAGAATGLYLQGGETLRRGLVLFDLEWDNIRAGQAWAAARAGQGGVTAFLCSAYADAGLHCLDLRQHPRERIAWLEAAVVAAQRLKDRRGEGNHVGNLGLAYHSLGQAERAIEYYQQALAIDHEICAASTAGSLEWIDARRGEGADLGNLGCAYAILGQAKRAIEYHEQALAISREISDRRGEGANLGNLGQAYADLGQAERAIEYHERALSISREIGDRRAEGNTLGNLGTAYAALGQVERAIEYHQQALSISREIGDRRAEGADLGNLGNAYRALGQVQRAIEHYQQALVISREIGDRRSEGTHTGNLGDAYRNLGQVERAIEHYQQALAIDREIGSRRGEGADLGNLGNAYYSLGQAERAIEHYQQALAISREIGDRHDEGVWLANLAKGYATVGQMEQARKSLEQALSIFEEVKSPNTGRVRRLLAKLG